MTLGHSCPKWQVLFDGFSIIIFPMVATLSQKENGSLNKIFILESLHLADLNIIFYNCSFDLKQQVFKLHKVSLEFFGRLNFGFKNSHIIMI